MKATPEAPLVIVVDQAAVRQVPAPGPERSYDIRPQVIPADLRKFYKLDSSDRVPEDPNDPAGFGFEMVMGAEPVINAPKPGGARAVVCYRTPLGLDGEHHRKDSWRWDVPRELQNRDMIWSEPDGERHKAVLLSPGRWEQANPVLLLFNAHKGLLWQQEVPLQAAAREARPPSAAQATKGERSLGGIHEISGEPRVAVTRDGSRTLVIVPCRARSQTFAFVYDRLGALRKSVAFNGMVCEGMDRTPKGTRVVLFFTHDPKLFGPLKSGKPAAVDFSYFLADLESNLLERFVDDKGETVGVGTVGQDDGYGIGVVRSSDKPDRLDKLLVFPLP